MFALGFGVAGAGHTRSALQPGLLLLTRYSRSVVEVTFGRGGDRRDADRSVSRDGEGMQGDERRSPSFCVDGSTIC